MLRCSAHWKSSLTVGRNIFQKVISTPFGALGCLLRALSGKPRQTVKRATLVVPLCVVLFVTAGFASTKKFQRSDGSRNWNDLPMQNGGVPGVEIGLSGGSYGFQSSGATAGSGSSLSLASPSTPDNWNGGTGNWSDAADWSAGEPGLNSEVTIYSGGNDNVTLDVSTHIDSLELGGVSNGTTSELTDGGVAQTLTITNGLTVCQTGFLDLTGASTVTAATMSNSGQVYIGTGATLNLTNQPAGITDVVAGSAYSIGGTFTAGANNAFYQLNSVEGTLSLRGQSFTDTAGSGTLTNSGSFYLDANAVGTVSNLTISGNLNNSGTFYLGQQYGYLGGGSTLNVTGTLTNGGTFALYYINPTADLGALNNRGTFYVNNEGYGGGVVNIAGDVTNSGSMYTQGGTFNAAGTLTNTGSFYLYGSGDAAGFGNVDNSAAFIFDNANQRVAVTNNLTNEATGTINLTSSGDLLQIGGTLTNKG